MYTTNLDVAQERAISPRDSTPRTRLDTIPFPEGQWFTYQSLMLCFGVSYKTLRNEVSEHREKLGPKYLRRGPHGREIRLFSASDVQLLREVFRVRVKQ